MYDGSLLRVALGSLLPLLILLSRALGILRCLLPRGRVGFLYHPKEIPLAPRSFYASRKCKLLKWANGHLTGKSGGGVQSKKGKSEG